MKVKTVWLDDATDGTGSPSVKRFVKGEADVESIDVTPDHVTIAWETGQAKTFPMHVVWGWAKT